MHYFNFYELQTITEDQIDAIFTLICGMTLGYNRCRFDNLKDFRRRCSPLIEIPRILRSKNVITKDYGKYSYSINYRVKIKLSYISNRLFLLDPKATIKDKVQYLKLLGYRSIKDKNTWIQADIVSDISKVCNNPLIKIQDDKIHFKYEKERIQ